jgi:arylsulfatase A-like enzyme
MFETVFNEITWDIHGSAPFSPISCYRDLVGPMFDHAYSSLLEDLQDRRLLQDTLVLAAGEFGRTPKVNPAGGRDHWTNCWTMVMAGGGIKGGQVVGSSDEIGAYPRDHPIAPPDIAATVYKALGIDIETPLTGAANRPIPIVDYGHHPIAALF